MHARAHQHCGVPYGPYICLLILLGLASLADM